MTRRDPDALNQRERAFVAAYVGTAAGNATAAARIAGYKGKTDAVIWTTASRVLSLTKVQRAIADANAVIARKGIRVKENRLNRLQKRWDAIDHEITARGAATAPGFNTAGTGIMAIEIDDLHRVKIRADTALLKEERELAKQAAIELGEWTEKTETNMNVTGDPVAIVEIVVGLDTAGRQRAEQEEADLDAQEWDGDTASVEDMSGQGVDVGWYDDPINEPADDDDSPF